jgi:predicted nuclease of predicted toxin-antitoxin system
VARRKRPSLRLLFDECLPWDVAEALLALGFNASFVGREEHGQPDRRSSDETILAHAMKTNQVVVTWNHDFILLCVEAGATVIWIDPRGRQILHDELAVMAIKGIAAWQRVLDEHDGPVCLRVLRTKTELLPLERAGSLVRRRMRGLSSKPGARSRRRAQVEGQIATPDP